ncbi:MAG: hypothetical protein VCA74_06760 [Deltaproteobacteria bacterium]
MACVSRTLDVFALLFAVLAVSNLLKPLQILGKETGFVLFGTRLEGTANAVAGPLFGIYLLVYAWAIWADKGFALPMAVVYVAYVAVNLVMFFMLNDRPGGASYLVFGVVYAAIALGVSGAAAWLLYNQRLTPPL